MLRKQNYFLLQQNASKNAIIKLLAENQQYANNTKEADSKLSMVLIQNCQRYFYKKMLQAKMRVYPTDDSDGSDFSSDTKLCLQEALHEIIIITQTGKRRN